jgi:hypothetical protein
VNAFRNAFRAGGDGSIQIGDDAGNYVFEITPDGLVHFEGVARMQRTEDGGLQIGDGSGAFVLELDGDGLLRARLAPQTIAAASFGSGLMI